MNENRDVSFRVSGGIGHKRRKFNIDGSEAMHVDVWVEALADKWFWLEYLRDNSEFKFTVKGPDEKIAKDTKKSTGCDRLFTLEKQNEIVLGQDCIFCLDSDDSYIKSFIDNYKSRKHPRKHVYVTNIYAIDNAYLLKPHIDHSFSLVTTKGSRATEHPPSSFIRNIASTLWKAYTGIYYLEAVGRNKEFTLSQKKAYTLVAKLQKTNAENYISCNIYKKFQTEALKLQNKVLTAINTVGNEKYQLFLKTLSEAGIDESNFYLFMRGHDLFDSTTCAYEKINAKYRTAEIERVKAEFKDFEHRVTYIENNWSKFPSFLVTKFSAHHTPVPFFERTLEQISSDYQLVH